MASLDGGLHRPVIRRRPVAWQSFQTIFAGVYERLRRLGPQPIWFTEVASDDRGGDKAAWVRDMFDTAARMID